MADVKTRADGGSAASQADDLDERSWTARPVMSFAIRVLVFIAPILGSVVTTYAYRAIVPAPSGLLPTIAWWCGAIAIVMASMRVFERVARKLLPVALMFQMSLVFPDNAPSRFKTALRTGTTRQLQRQLDVVEHGAPATTPTEAAETLLALITRLSTHDRMTRGHSERVRGYTDLIAKEMGLPAKDREKLHWAALIHDVGKLRIPPSILNKKGRPTDEEWEILKTHPAAGERLVDPLRGWLGEWALATTQHHERYDGKGYPNGLAGTEISLAGRIVAVADAYDVMTSSRSYKKPLPAAQARAELTKNAGTQFDPSVVRAFLAVGLGKTQMMYGPLAWLTELQGFSQLSAAASTSAGAAATAAVTVAAVSVGSVMAVGGPINISSAPSVERVVELPAEQAAEGAAEDAVAAAEPKAGDKTPEAGKDLSSPAAPETTTTTTVSATTTTAPPMTTTTTAPMTTTTTAPMTTTTTAPPMTTTTTAPPMTTTTTVPPTTTVPATTTQPPPGGPSSTNDFVTVGSGATQIDVLSNDIAGEFPLSIRTLSIIVPPTHAGNYRVDGNRLLYHALDGYSGPDQMTYQICDTGGECDTAIVYITVEP